MELSALKRREKKNFNNSTVGTLFFLLGKREWKVPGKCLGCEGTLGEFGTQINKQEEFDSAADFRATHMEVRCS